jgi:hypothetical protein
MNPDTDPILPASAEPEPADTLADRRAALKKLGKLAVWTTPTLMVLTLSPRASARSCGGPNLPPCPPGPPPGGG